MMFSVYDYFSLDEEPLAFIFNNCIHPWDLLRALPCLVRDLVPELVVLGDVHSTAVISGNVFIGKGAKIEPHVYIKGPAYIGENATVRQGAYVREESIISEGATLGHNSEIKASVMLRDSSAPHFAYLGDSIIGRKVNLGAGTVLANFKLTADEVVVTQNETRIPTGLRKFGAIIGDHSLLGCNSVTAPGTLIGKRCLIYSLISVRGVIPDSSIVKPASGFVVEARRDTM
jgi:NDP-sugar pyrophosphorylase family protein